MVYGILRYFLGLERISRYYLAVRVEEKKNISAGSRNITNYSRAQLFKSYGSVVFQRSLSRMFSQCFLIFFCFVDASGWRKRVKNFALRTRIFDQ